MSRRMLVVASAVSLFGACFFAGLAVLELLEPSPGVPVAPAPRLERPRPCDLECYRDPLDGAWQFEPSPGAPCAGCPAWAPEPELRHGPLPAELDGEPVPEVWL